MFILSIGNLFFQLGTALSVGHRICRLHPLQRGKTPPMGPPVGRGWIPVRSEDGILVVECSGSQGLALPLYNTPLWPLLGPKTGGWKWPVPINRLVMTCPKAHTFLQTYCSYINCSLCFVCLKMCFRRRWLRVNRFWIIVLYG